MTNKKLSKELEWELMDALCPEYSEYMFYKAKEWANVDGDQCHDREFFLDYQFTEWDDYFWMEEIEWENYNMNHNGRYEINEAA